MFVPPDFFSKKDEIPTADGWFHNMPLRSVFVLGDTVNILQS